MANTDYDYPKNNIGRELIPLKITNQTNRENLYFYLVGTTEPLDQANHCYYLSNFNGDVTLCTKRWRDELFDAADRHGNGHSIAAFVSCPNLLFFRQQAECRGRR